MEKGTSILDKLGVDIGTKRIHMHTITDADIVMFSGISGDTNYIHMCEQYAQKTMFKGRIAHGILALGWISAALAKFPGTAIYLSQSINFIAPMRVGDSITATAEVINVRKDKGILTLKTTCTNQEGKEVAAGEAGLRLYEAPE
jgi:3-hydroxybutyryl-CoA dehydratase